MTTIKNNFILQCLYYKKKQTKIDINNHNVSNKTRINTWAIYFYFIIVRETNYLDILNS